MERLENLKWYFDAEKLGGKTEAELVVFMIKEVREMWDGLDVKTLVPLKMKYKIESVDELIDLLKK